MSFAGLSPLAVVLGLVALGAILFALQLLRVRHTEVPVVTTMFWRQAIEEARARVFLRRFRHLPAWLLLLAICSLLWLAFAQPHATAGGEDRLVLLLDGSAGMARGTRFQEAAARLEAEAREWPADRTAVIFCGGRAHTLLVPGEDRLLLSRRLSDFKPEPAPASVEPTIASLAAEQGAALTVRLFGDAPLTASFLKGLPDNVTVERAELPEAAGPVGNRGITALGISAAASGAWDAVDVFVEARGRPLETSARIHVTLDGRPFTQAGSLEREAGRALRVRLLDVPATGGILNVRLDGQDDLPIDDAAEVILPDRSILRVALDPSLRPVLKRVLAADPGLRLVEGQADVVVVAGPAPAGGPPALVFGDAEDAAHAILVFDRGGDPAQVLQNARRDLQLAAIDGAALASKLGRSISVGAAIGEARRIEVWRRLLGADVGFVESRALPIFLAHSLRWLAGVESLHEIVAAGEAESSDAGPYTNAAGQREDPAGDSFTPPTAGRYVDESGRRVAASLLDLALTAPPSPSTAATVPAAGGTAALDFVLVLMLLAFALLLLEWGLYRTGRIP